MIRNTLAATKTATFSVEIPDPRMKGMPTPTGTGFFVSPDGWFVTAAHVVTEEGASGVTVKAELGKSWLIQPADSQDWHLEAMYTDMILDYLDLKNDVALLKVPRRP